jgi:hypothetical protein
MRKWLERFRDAFNWGWLLYRVIWVLVVTGIGSAIGGTIWGVMIGVPGPILLMAGYCTLVGAVYLAMAPLAYRVLSQSPANTLAAKGPKRPEPPNYPAVRLMHQYSLEAAGKLWADVDQNAQGTYDSESWYQVLKGAVQRSELPFEMAEPRPRGTVSREPGKIGYSTIVTRKNLQKFASSINQDPIFLRDS